MNHFYYGEVDIEMTKRVRECVSYQQDLTDKGHSAQIDNTANILSRLTSVYYGIYFQRLENRLIFTYFQTQSSRPIVKLF